jgi:2-dehydro-3-deoxygluconokinase
MKKVCCFGELLLRMSPALGGAWIHESMMPVYVGGAELNVANALAKWDLPVKYCTALPDNYLSRDICSDLEKKNIDISSIVFLGNRIGVYYLAQGTDLKNVGVIYDRANSSFSQLNTGQIDWDNVLHDVNWFHFSAISPALNQQVANLCKEGLIQAEKKGITISVDLNYRARLWEGKQAIEIISSLVEHCNVVMGNIWSAHSLLGIELDKDIHDKKTKEAYLEHASQTANAIMQKFPTCKMVANTFRFDNNSSLQYYASLNNSDEQFVAREFYTTSIIDRVGSGDCFMAGLLYGLTNKLPLQKVVDFAAAAAFGKLQEKGDSTNQTVENVLSKIQHDR